MKITPRNTTGATSPASLTKTVVQDASLAPATTPVPVSEASVASHVQTADSVSSAEAPFDSQRVAEIRQAIAEGRFQVNPGKIADKLLSEVRALLRG
jgi:negative regulator of flagellin synthesis FlgM